MPYISNQFPNCKLIFIATGAKFRPKSLSFKLLLRIVRWRLFPEPSKIISIFPKRILYFLYGMISPFANIDEKWSYEKDRRENLRAVSKMTIKSCREIANMMERIDNTALLKNFDNKTLIISGKSDNLMPATLGRELKSLLKIVNFLKVMAVVTLVYLIKTPLTRLLNLPNKS